MVVCVLLMVHSFHCIRTWLKQTPIFSKICSVHTWDSLTTLTFWQKRKCLMTKVYFHHVLETTALLFWIIIELHDIILRLTSVSPLCGSQWLFVESRTWAAYGCLILGRGSLNWMNSWLPQSLGKSSQKKGEDQYEKKSRQQNLRDDERIGTNKPRNGP